MKRVLAATAITSFLSLGLAAPAFAGTGNPSGTGRPSQSCLSDTAPNTPGNASTAPGSAFNEPGTVTSTNPGGIGGQNYAGNGTHTTSTSLANGQGVAAQYDVACFHQPG
jgi:hypothetical protein